MNVDFYSSEELHLRFVDQQHIQNKPKTLLNDYNPLQLRNINFYDLFDIDQSVNQSNSQSNFFTNQDIKPQTHEKQELALFLQSQMGPFNNLISHRKTAHQFKNNNLMKNIQNIDFPTNYQELTGIFLRSHYFIYFLRFIVIANLVGLFLVNYEFRISKNGEIYYPPLSAENIAAIFIQIYCNCIFTIEIILRFYEKSQNWKDPYVIVNSIGTISCWATIFFDLIANDSNQLFRFFLVLRIIRTVIRILEVFPNLRKPFEIFLSTIPSLQKLFFPIIVLMIFYAITGMALFSGATKYHCVEVVDEVKHYKSFCGANLFSCPQHQHCQKIQDQDTFINSHQNQYNLVNFDNIFKGLFTVYHFIYNSNFNNTRGKFTYFINPYLSSLYFLSLSIIFCYIFANLIMVSMSKVYMQQIVHQQHQQEKSDSSKIENQGHIEPLTRVVKIVEIVFIIFQAVNICFTYTGMSNQAIQKQALIDFILLWITLGIVLVKIALEKSAYFSEYFNILDLLTLGIHVIDIFACISLNKSIINYTENVSIILRSLKILRIIRLLYAHEGIFKYEKFVITVLLQTLYKIRYFLGMIICFIFMFKQIGQLLFAYQIRTSLDQINTEKAPYIKNFEGFIPSMFNIIFLFYNQMWTETLYNYYHAAGIQAIFFYSIVVFICYLMLMRLYIAVFLSFFKEALHKKSQQQNAQYKTSKRLKQSRSRHNAQMLQSSQNENQEQKKASCLISLIQNVYQSDFFSHVIDACIILQSILITIRQSSDSDKKISIISSFEIICFTFYLVQTLLGCISYGVYFPKNSFLKRSRSSKISFSTSIIIILGFIPFGNSQVNNYLKRIVVLRIFTLFRNSNKQMTIIIDSLFVICKNFFNFVFIYSFFLIIVSIIPLKMFYNSNPFHICYFSDVNNDNSTFLTQEECTQLGGVWKQPVQTFSNIFSSVALMYQLIATQSWTSYLQSLWYKNKNLHWQLYFSITFFVYNICFLNIFLGFIVETYLQLKDKAYNLDQLKRSQKAWVLIKNRINILFPLSTLTIEEESSERRKMFYSIITNTYYQVFIDYLAIFNAFLYLITYEGMNGGYKSALIFFKNCTTIIFFVDALGKLYSLRSNYFKRNNSTIQLSGFVYTIIYWIIHMFSIPNIETAHILQFFLVCHQLLRCKSLLLKYSWCKTNLNAVINILPRCGNIIKIVGALLFFYASLGLEIFKNIKPDNIIDNYNIGFCDMITATLTLVRVSVAEGWHTVLSAYLKQSSPQNICYNISTQADAMAYEGHGCGSWVAFPYFISFHILMVLLLLNLLIATMSSAYDDNYEIQFNSVNVFQLQDCLSLWQKYDPQGTGVVHYKKFWRLTSEIAILFGISKKKLIKRKNKFFEELDIQIYQHKDNPLFCYRFHDVITKFSKIKLQIAHLGYAQQKSDSNEEYDISFDISPAVLSQIKDYIIPFPEEYYSDYHPFRNFKSGETKYIFGLLNKVRQWRHVSTEKKRIVGGTKLSSIFDLKSRRIVYDSQEGSDHII